MPSTATKIKFARLLYRLLHLVGVRNEQLVTRSGVRYHLDLREGIDLSIFLFGGFQNHVAEVAPGAAEAFILDVGANIGGVALPLARRHPQAQVHCFEPTHFAFHKLQRNLALNPDLQGRVVINNVFAGSFSGEVTHAAAYASWRIDGAGRGMVHDTHQGSMMEATTFQTTLDDYAKAHGIPTVHMLKIDTDGNELEVLKGAQEIIAAHRPRIVMEMCPYLLKEKHLSLTDYSRLLGPGYRMTDVRTGREFDDSALARVPARGGTDVLAEPA